ncbi:hypothetical protein C8R45DRAFT_1142866 [Mycena sanguinolenta]|nr:hypothetical protein C8R45DRAFT_1142866 [Mycena sanguinolenta]
MIALIAAPPLGDYVAEKESEGEKQVHPRHAHHVLRCVQCYDGDFSGANGVHIAGADFHLHHIVESISQAVPTFPPSKTSKYGKDLKESYMLLSPTDKGAPNAMYRAQKTEQVFDSPAHWTCTKEKTAPAAAVMRLPPSRTGRSAQHTPGGRVYGSILVFLTQELDLRHNSRSGQTLTTIHDDMTSWSGLGSALGTLYKQLPVPSSVVGTLTILGYLACVSVLHITTPAIISVQIFNNTVPVPISTQWLPSFNVLNPAAISATRDYMTVFPAQFLPWLGNLNGVQTIGLFNGSLYEVLDTSGGLGNGTAPVSAMAFNITCSYFPATINASGYISVFLDVGPFGTIRDVDPTKDQSFTVVQMISYSTPPNNSILIFTTREVLDSMDTALPPLDLNDQDWLGAPILPMHCLQCSKSLVPQSGTVSSPSRTLNVSSLAPNIYKTHSTWPSPNIEISAQDSSLVGSDVWTSALTGPSDFTDTNDFSAEFTPVEEYLMEYLNIDPLANRSEVPPLRLHEIENSLSSLIASVFWIGGHILPDSVQLGHPADTLDGVSYNPGIPPELEAGNTVLQQEELQGRLEISLVATSFSLGAAIALLILNARVLLNAQKSQSPIVGCGFLDHIWFTQRYKHHLAFLSMVEQPAELHLRVASQRTMGQLSKEAVPMDLRERSAAFAGKRSIHDLAGGESHSQAYRPINYSRVACLGLHISLFLVHIALLGVAWREKEKTIVFPINLQGTVSFWTKFITTSLGTVTTPALLSIEAFNFSTTFPAPSLGVPQWNDTRYNTTLTYVQYVAEFLPWIQNLDEAQTPGLFNGSLYDATTQVYSGGTANVSAVGFNITCGYIPWYNAVGDEFGTYNVTLEPTSEFIYIDAPGPDIVGLHNPTARGDTLQTVSDSIIGYTTNKLLDSNQGTGFPVLPRKEDNSTVYNFQLFRCSRSIVHQSATLDTEAGKIIPSSLYPNLQKNYSSWHLYNSSSENDNLGTLVDGDSWATILGTLPSTGLFWGEFNVGAGDLFLMSQLGLTPVDQTMSNQTGTNRTLYLDEIENALGSLLASALWIAGHIHPSQLMMNFEASQNATILMSGDDEVVIYEPGESPVLMTGIVVVTQVNLAARLNISLGLGASTILLMLSMVFLPEVGTPQTLLARMGLLQVIWIVQHHPELQEILEEAQDTTEHSLRAAGLVKIRLLDAYPD